MLGGGRAAEPGEWIRDSGITLVDHDEQIAPLVHNTKVVDDEAKCIADENYIPLPYAAIK